MNQDEVAVESERMEINNSFVHKACPFCAGEFVALGAIPTADLMDFSSHKIHLTRTPVLNQCRHCQSAFTQNAIPPDLAFALYSKGKGSERWASPQTFEQSKTNDVVKALENMIKPGFSILDFGCNTGDLLDFAAAHGCETHGVEPSDDGRQVALERKHRVFKSLGEVSQTFDIITAFDLIEHVYDARDMITQLSSYLKPEGLLVIFTGNIESKLATRDRAHWWYVQFPEHVAFPSLSFFRSLKEFELHEVVFTYAEKRLEPRLLRGVYNIMRGKPAANNPDHMMVMLRKL